jgi:hypothetical protein
MCGNNKNIVGTLLMTLGMKRLKSSELDGGELHQKI